MSRSIADTVSKPTGGACAFALPEQLPDDPAALKALLQTQQRAFEAREVAQQEAFNAREAEQHEAFKAREAEQRKVFEIREAKQVTAFKARILELYVQLRLSRSRMFGRSGESHAGQGWLFDEAEALLESAPQASDTANLPPVAEAPAGTGKKKARGKRKPLPAELHRIEVIHDIPEAERTCACGTTMVEIGEQVSEQLDIVAMQVRVLRHIRKRYGCPKGDEVPDRRVANFCNLGP